MRGFFKLLEGVMLFGLVFYFIRWFIKGLFGKYFYIFWIWLLAAIAYQWAYSNPKIMLNHTWPQHNSMTGAEAWNKLH